MIIRKYGVQLVKESSSRYPIDSSISGTEAAKEIARTMLDGLDREHLIVFMLDCKNKVIGVNTVSIGTLSMTTLHPREVFKPAILANASSIIIAHNHPSGDTTPSTDDVEALRRTREAGRLLGIEVLDSLIAGAFDCRSLRDDGLFD